MPPGGKVSDVFSFKENLSQEVARHSKKIDRYLNEDARNFLNKVKHLFRQPSSIDLGSTDSKQDFIPKKIDR